MTTNQQIKKTLNVETTNAQPTVLDAAIERTDWTRPNTQSEAYQLAERLAKSDLAPKDYKGKPENAFIAIQMGAELGLSPMQAIQNIAVINGRPSLWGDAMRALVINHPDFAGIEESDDGTTATCVIKRKINGEIFSFTQKFSVDDVKKAGLGGVHDKYPRRMRQMRAFGYSARDAFADALKGLDVREAVQEEEVARASQTQSTSKHAHIAQKLGVTLSEPKPADPVVDNETGEILNEAPIKQSVYEKAQSLEKMIADNNLLEQRERWLDAKKASSFEEFSESAIDWCIAEVNRVLQKKQSEKQGD